MVSKPWRKFWHLAGGSFLPVFALFVSREVLLVFTGLIAAILIGWEVTRLTVPGVNQWSLSHLGGILKEEQRTRPIGTTYALISSLAVFVLFDKFVAVLSLFFRRLVMLWRR
jgi:hypothetical protein